MLIEILIPNIIGSAGVVVAAVSAAAINTKFNNKINSLEENNRIFDENNKILDEKNRILEGKLDQWIADNRAHIE